MQEFEQRICEKLKSENLEKVAHDCLQSIIQFNQADLHEVEKTLSFLIQFGFYHEAKKIILWLINKNELDVMWKYLGILLSKTQISSHLINHLAPELNIDSLNDDLLIAALMLEDYQTAVQIAQYLDANEKNDWLKMEVFLLAEHALELLQLSFEIEAKYALQADALYACLYYRAQAYFLLDDKQKALEIMNEILAHEPHYRRAAQLLREWSEK